MINTKESTRELLGLDEAEYEALKVSGAIS